DGPEAGAQRVERADGVAGLFRLGPWPGAGAVADGLAPVPPRAACGLGLRPPPGRTKTPGQVAALVPVSPVVSPVVSPDVSPARAVSAAGVEGDGAAGGDRLGDGLEAPATDRGPRRPVEYARRIGPHHACVADAAVGRDGELDLDLARLPGAQRLGGVG